MLWESMIGAQSSYNPAEMRRKLHCTAVTLAISSSSGICSRRAGRSVSQQHGYNSAVVPDALSKSPPGGKIRPDEGELLMQKTRKIS
ncbi:hypothetical protein [Acetobacter sp. DsW_059]|uniref:hypothetical protein n=1 Tax=Acetobacter sp. DsW_059 TaxID=1670661 RepID=UPI001178663F|nr:hypothetical protein [Acetobacter sp. DsW_059]